MFLQLCQRSFAGVQLLSLFFHYSAGRFSDKRFISKFTLDSLDIAFKARNFFIEARQLRFAVDQAFQRDQNFQSTAETRGSLWRLRVAKELKPAPYGTEPKEWFHAN